MSVAAAIPWKVLLQSLPTVVATARQLWKHWSSRPEATSAGPNADVKTQLSSIADRLAALEGAETEQAQLVSQMAEQLQGVARRVSIAYWLGCGGLVLSSVALLLTVLR